MLRQLFKKSLLYFATLVGGKLLSAVFFVLLARILQPEKFGEISFFLTLVQVIAVLSDVGLKSWYQKTAATDHEPLLLTRLTWWRLLFYGVSVAILALVQTTLRLFDAGLFVSLLVSLFLEALLTVADAYYLAGGESLALGYKLIARNLLLFVGLAFIRTPADVTIFYHVYNLSLLVVVLFYFPRDAIHWSQLFSRYSLTTLPPKQTFSYAAIDDLGILYSRADQLLIERLLDATALGLYSAAYRFVDAFNLLPQALFHNLFPLAAKKNGISRLQIVKMEIAMTLLGLLVALGLFIASDWLTVFLLGETYAPAGSLLRGFCIVIVMFFFNAPLNTILQSSDDVSTYVPFLCLSTILNILLNLIFIPLWGAAGSVAAMIIGEGVLLVINVVLVCRQTSPTVHA